MQIGHFIDKGDRDYQEDSFLMYSGVDWTLIAVADGMGGHVNGTAASGQCISVLTDCIPQISELLEDYNTDEAVKLLQGAFNSAHHLLTSSGDEWDNRGSTLVLALIVKDECWFLNQGDSFGFVVLENYKAEQITHEHGSGNVVYRMIGGYRRNARSFWDRGPKNIGCDVHYKNLTSEVTHVVVASDGIVSPGSILFDRDEHSLAGMTAAEAAEQLGNLGLAEYRRQGGNCADNCTVVVLKR